MLGGILQALRQCASLATAREAAGSSARMPLPTKSRSSAGIVSSVSRFVADALAPPGTWVSSASAPASTLSAMVGMVDARR
jgi:hypothetical protein